MKQTVANVPSSLTSIAKGIVVVVGVAALAVLVVLLPELIREETVGKPTDPNVIYAFLGFSYLLATPFFVALLQTLKLLQNIDRNRFFTQSSIQTLQYIKVSTILFSALVIVGVIGGMHLALSIDPTEDVTFMVTLGGMLVLVSSVITVFVAVLKKLLTDAVLLKSENDLII